MAKQQEEQKLGPSVTYLGANEDDKTPVTISNVRFKPGESVNLEERLGKTSSDQILKKLAGNQFFKVDGGPDHKAQREAAREAETKQDEEIQQENLEKAGYQPPEENKLEKPNRRAKREPGDPTFE